MIKITRPRLSRLFVLAVPLFLVACNGPEKTPTTPPGSVGGGPLCLKDADLGTTTYFTCPKTGDEYVLAQSDVIIERVYIHPEKQLKKLDTIPGRECGDARAYVAYCHPPDYGCLHRDFIFLLNSAKFEDGAIFDVVIKKGAKVPDCIKCKGGGTPFSLDSAAILAADKTIKFKGSDFIYVMTLTIDDNHVSPSAVLLGTHPMGGETYNVYKNFLRGVSDNDDIIYLTKESSPFPSRITYHEYHRVSVPLEAPPTLILKTFRPPAKRGWWLHWVPECKPLVYLYPEKETTLTLRPKPEGFVTVTDPKVNTYKGWEGVTAYPDGRIIYRDKEYGSLYYESLINKVFIPEEGFVIKRNELKMFFEEYLPKLGLNEKEASEFKEYWLGRLTTHPYYFVRFLTPEEIEKIEPLEVSIEPDTIIRVRAYFRPLDEPVDVAAQKLGPTPQRAGFTLAEWGGLYDDPNEPFYVTPLSIAKNALKQFKDWLTK